MKFIRVDVVVKLSRVKRPGCPRVSVLQLEKLLSHLYQQHPEDRADVAFFMLHYVLFRKHRRAIVLSDVV